MHDKIPGLCDKHGFTDRITGTPARVHTQLVCPFCRIEQLEGLLAEETAAREAAEESVCKLGGGPRTMNAEEVDIIKAAGGDILQLAKMVLWSRRRSAAAFVKHLCETEEKFFMQAPPECNGAEIDFNKFPWDRILKRFEKGLNT